MRQIRTSFCAFSFVASLAALVQHFGVDLWGCASCSLVNDLPISKALAWLGPPILAALVYGQYVDVKWAKVGLVIAACGSSTLITWMILHNTVCIVCMLVHIGVLSAALCLIPRVKFLGPLFFSVAVVFTATDGWDRLTGSRETGIFRPRDHETIPDGTAYVLFTDPECSRCQMAEAQISRLPKPPTILHRWTLLPQNTYRSIRAIALLEMTRTNKPELFEKLRSEILRTQPPLTDSALLAAATKTGLANQAKSWLDQPSENVLIAIEGDQTTSQELKIESLPALAVLSAPDATGTRTLHRVPFSAIGLPP